MDKNFVLQDSQHLQLQLEEVGATARAGALLLSPKHSLSCLLPRFWYDNPASVPKPGWLNSLHDSFLHFAQPVV